MRALVLAALLLGGTARADEVDAKAYGLVLCSLQHTQHDDKNEHEYLIVAGAARVTVAPVDAARLLIEAIKFFRAQAKTSNVRPASCGHVRRLQRCVSDPEDASCPDVMTDDGTATRQASRMLDEYWSSLGD